jgi:hypothetical protein
MGHLSPFCWSNLDRLILSVPPSADAMGSLMVTPQGYVYVVSSFYIRFRFEANLEYHICVAVTLS